MDYPRLKNNQTRIEIREMTFVSDGPLLVSVAFDNNEALWRNLPSAISPFPANAFWSGLITTFQLRKKMDVS